MSEQQMPARIWVDTHSWDAGPSRHEEDTVFIRADIAERMAEALETAAARFNLMAGVGLVNGADPKVGYQEALAALSAFKDSAQETRVMSEELKALEAERAELMAKNAAATSWGAAVGARHERIMAIDRTLAALAAAGEQKPVAWRWRVVGDSSWTMAKTKPVVKAGSPARFEVEIEPLYAAPQPAPGWGEAIEAAAQIAVRYCVSPQCVSDIRALTKSAVVKDYLTTRLDDKELDATVRLTVVSWEGRIHCAYINYHRIAGGKPWAGGTTEKEWNTSLREVIRAFPELQKALGFDYLGRPLRSSQSTSDAGGGVRDALKPFSEYCPTSIMHEDGAWVLRIPDNARQPMYADFDRARKALYNPAAADSPHATLTYTNYRGETSVRSIVPKSVRYGATEWHPEPQWLLLAHDTEKNADREFALKDFGTAAADSNASYRVTEDDLVRVIKKANVDFGGWETDLARAILDTYKVSRP